MHLELRSVKQPIPSPRSPFCELNTFNNSAGAAEAHCPAGAGYNKDMLQQLLLAPRYMRDETWNCKPAVC
jgi:hypothetical protein